MDLGALGDTVGKLLDWALSFGTGWIYLGIVLASFVENIFPPFPGDTVTVAGAAVATTGEISFVLVFAAAYLGGMFSTMLIYWFGRRHGYGYFREKDFRYFPGKKLDEFRDWLDRRGVWLITLNRFVVGFRTLVALSAGIGRWPVGQMILFSSISFWLFNALLMGLTYLLVDNLELLIKYLKVSQTYIFAAVILLLGWVVYRFVKSHKQSAENSKDHE